MDELKYCQYCGKELPKSAVFCTQCGKKLLGGGQEPGAAREVAPHRDLVISGNAQFNIGDHVVMVQNVQSLPAVEKIELKDLLSHFKEEISGLDLPENESDMAKGDVATAINETEKPEPDVSEIRKSVKNAMETVKKSASKAAEILSSPAAMRIMEILGLALRQL